MLLAPDHHVTKALQAQREINDALGIRPGQPLPIAPPNAAQLAVQGKPGAPPQPGAAPQPQQAPAQPNPGLAQLAARYNAGGPRGRLQG